MPRIPDHVHGEGTSSNERSAQCARSLIGRTNNDAQAGSGDTIANRPKQFFYCPLCSCIALIDQTTTTYYVWVTAFVFKAPCSESFSFFSFLALFSFFHVTAAPHSSLAIPFPAHVHSALVGTFVLIKNAECLASSRSVARGPDSPILHNRSGANTRGAWRAESQEKHEKEKKTK